MRVLDVARGDEVVLRPFAADAPAGGLLISLALGGVLVALDAALEVSGFALFDMPLGARVESVVPVAAGRLRSMSPADVLVTVSRAAPALDRTQSVVLMAESDAEAFVVDDAAASAVEVVLVDGVTPVPFAPFVLFSPVKRCSGLVAVLRAESDVVPAAPPVVAVVEPELVEAGLIVVVAV